MKQNNADCLDVHLDKIESLIPERDVKNENISRVDVAWHLDHMLKTIKEITKSLEKSNPENYKSGFNPVRVMSLTLGFIPRGRAQAPTVVRPPENIKTEDIISQLQVARDNLVVLNNLDKKAHFAHPVFGTIDKATSIRFIEVHTKHHLKIIKDILNN